MFQCTFSFTLQVDRLVARGAQTMYAIGTLRRHGLTGPLLWELTRATFIARLTYVSQAWWGLLDAQGRNRLEGVLKKAIKGFFLPKTHPTFAQICDSADERMFGEILRNPGHTPASSVAPYQPRPRAGSELELMIGPCLRLRVMHFRFLRNLSLIVCLC